MPSRASWLISAALLSACASILAGGTPPNLVGTHWVRIDDEDAAPHFPRLEFGPNGAAGFLPGCEDWSADVKTTGTALSFVHLEPAHLECEGGAESSRAAARSLLSALAATRSAQVADNADGGELTLLDARGDQVARFARLD